MHNRCPVRPYWCLLTLLAVFAACPAGAQTIDDEGSNFDHYRHEIIRSQEAISLPYIREDDVVWELTIWRTVDLREKFNQFIYFPTEPEGIHGRRCLARVIWDAVVANEIPIFIRFRSMCAKAA